MSKTYTTKQGDKWDSIAYTQLGDSNYADGIMNLNQKHRGYYSFPAGVVLTLPDVAEEAADNLPPWKQVVSE